MEWTESLDAMVKKGKKGKKEIEASQEPEVKKANQEPKAIKEIEAIQDKRVTQDMMESLEPMDRAAWKDLWGRLVQLAKKVKRVSLEILGLTD